MVTAHSENEINCRFCFFKNSTNQFNPTKPVSKAIFNHLDRFSRNLAKTDKKLQFLGIEKCGINLADMDKNYQSNQQRQ